MNSNQSLPQTLSEIINILSQNLKLKINPIKIKNDQIFTPLGNILPPLQNHKSPLPNSLINLKILENLLAALDKTNAILRLNHIGFCYKVDSQRKEKTKIINQIMKSKTHLYEEPSNDEGLWLFVGDIKNWEDPTIEILPVKKTTDPNIDYWLPHIHIDIDTTLNDNQIKSLIKSVFSKKIIPYPIIIDGTTYIVRNRLGIVNGINIFLDLATNSRNVKFQKEKIWKEII